MELKKRKKNQGGFTLIELVSVVIILGILAAVIVPKYFDMTGKAQDGAYKGALNEGMARLNMAYAQYLMTSSVKPAQVSALQGSNLLGTDITKVNIGDYNIKYVGSTSATTITLMGSDGTSTLKYSDNTDAAKTVPWPD